MPLLTQYGSDSEESSASADEARAPTPVASTSSASAAASPPIPAGPLQSQTKPKGKKPLVIGTNSALLAKLGVRALSDGEDEESGYGPAKKRKKHIAVKSNGDADIQKEGKGKSSLVDMLPPPKRSAPIPKPTVPSASSSSSAQPPIARASSAPSSVKDAYLLNDGTMLPRVMVKGGKGKALSEAEEAESEVDFFGIAAESQPSSSRLPSIPTVAPPTSSSISITSAPLAPDFVPPSPHPSDPYPGYYPLPSGEWAAHDPNTYSAYISAQARLAEESLDPQSGKGGNVDRMWDTTIDVGGLQEVDVMGQLNKEKRELEERKRHAPPDLYSEESSYKAVGKTTGRAGQRHQLSALLKDAHSNRAALEERIAANKRTKKDSGAKYGF